MSEAYSVHVVPDQTSDGIDCYLAYHPELQGCMSHGDTVIEALKNLEDARSLYLKTMRELGQEPPPSFHSANNGRMGKFFSSRRG